VQNPRNGEPVGVIVQFRGLRIVYSRRGVNVEKLCLVKGKLRAARRENEPG
jgi:hypothetical protein